MTKRFFVDFYDMIDGWGRCPDFYPNRQFDNVEGAIKKRDELNEELDQSNKNAGEHYGVIDLEKGMEVQCPMDKLKEKTK